jgi:DNA/RNA endonuclease YhcR with UshA esterase domain
MRQESSVKRVALWVIAGFAILGSITLQQGYAQESPLACTLATLKGLYVFDATGYDIVNSTPAPKAVVELLTLKGDGTLTSLATVSLDGAIHSHVSGSGIYTVNQDCTGTLTFNGSGFTFDLFIAPNGNRFHMIETVSNTVLAGEVRRMPQ